MTTSSSIPSPRVPIEIGAQLRLRSPEPKALCAQQSLPEQRPDQLAFQHAPDAVEGGEDRGEDIGRLGRGLLVILPGLAGLVLLRLFGRGGAQELVDRMLRQARLLLLGLFLRRMGRRLRSEEHTSELQSLMRISYAVFCLK